MSIGKIILSITIALSMSACGGGGDSGGGTTTTKDTLAISGIGQTATVSSANKTDLTISGLNNTVNIKSNLGALVLSGSNNILIFSANITVDSCAISGNDNTTQKAGAVSMTCNNSGLGNTGF